MCELLALAHFILNQGHLLTISLQLRENVLLHRNSEYMLYDFMIDFIDFISYYSVHISQLRYSFMPCHSSSLVDHLQNCMALVETHFSSAKHLSGKSHIFYMKSSIQTLPPKVWCENHTLVNTECHKNRLKYGGTILINE